MENRIKLKEAILQAQLNGQVIVKGKLATKLFPSDNPRSSSVILYNYITGKSFKIDRETVIRMCLELKTDPNYLFGWEE